MPTPIFPPEACVARVRNIGARPAQLLDLIEIHHRSEREYADDWTLFRQALERLPLDQLDAALDEIWGREGKPMNKAELLSLLCEQDQDETQAVAWFNDSDPAELMKLWDIIQLKYDDPIREAISRLAQLGMTRVALLARGEP